MRNFFMNGTRIVVSGLAVKTLVFSVLYLNQPWSTPTVTEGWAVRNDDLSRLFAGEVESLEAQSGLLLLPPHHQQVQDNQTALSKIDLNKATLEELDRLPGIGPAKAKAILEYRQQAGSFHATDELLKVKGIGDKIYAAVKDLVFVPE